MKTAEDKLILRGHEFTSRFILGKPVLKKQMHRSSHWLCAGRMREDLPTSWIISRKMSHFCRIRQEQELQRRQCESQDFQEK